jgi:two-component system sensor histidine kinase KdpD
VNVRDAAHAADGLLCCPGGVAPPGARGGFADLVGRVARTGAPLAVRSTGVVDILPPTPEPTQVLDGLAGDVREVVLPLRVRDRTVGVLSLGRPAAFALEPSQRRFLNALAYYAALGVDRVRLVAEAEHADALRTAARLEDAVVASVSHDLRTPLTTIKALAHDLAASGDERAMTIEEEANRLNAFVADLLDLSRLNSGTASLAPEPNEAEDLLGAALQRVDGPARGREIRVSLEEGEPLRFGRFDFAQTLRALVNLIENAVKHSPPDQAVDVAVRREGAWLAFAVADRGPGVPSEARERIFERLQWGPDSTGSGLGLTLVAQLAALRRGSVPVTESPGGRPSWRRPCWWGSPLGAPATPVRPRRRGRPDPPRPPRRRARPPAART